MIDAIFKIVANCLHGAVFVLLIVAAFVLMLGGRRGAIWVVNRALTLMKKVIRANVIMLIRLGRKTCLFVWVLIRCICMCIYRLSRKNWMPWSRFREQQPGMRITRIQRLKARAQDNTQERPRDTHWE